MNTPNQPGHETRGEDVLESLFSHATSRTRPPVEDEAAVRQAVHSEWKTLLRQKRRRRIFAMSMAASLVLAVIAGLQLRQGTITETGPVQLAQVSRQSGDIFIRHRDERPEAARRLANERLGPGMILRTGPEARIAIEMTSGESLRVDQHSRIAFLTGNRVELQEGQLYLDNHLQEALSQSTAGLKIVTGAGTIEHIGTQYMATTTLSGISVRVREGSVRVSGAHSDAIGQQGEQLNIGRAGETEILPIETHGRAWSWVEQVTPGYVLDGKSALEFIRWVGRETGRAVVFEPDGSESLARATELRGSIELEPGRALVLILQTSDLEPIIEDGQIRIRKRMDA